MRAASRVPVQGRFTHLGLDLVTGSPEKGERVTFNGKAIGQQQRNHTEHPANNIGRWPTARDPAHHEINSDIDDSHVNTMLESGAGVS